MGDGHFSGIFRTSLCIFEQILSGFSENDFNPFEQNENNIFLFLKQNPGSECKM